MESFKKAILLIRVNPSEMFYLLPKAYYMEFALSLYKCTQIQIPAEKWAMHTKIWGLTKTWITLLDDFIPKLSVVGVVKLRKSYHGSGALWSEISGDTFSDD